MKSKLETLGLPFVEIEVFGSQILITCKCRESANRWTGVVKQFATLRGVAPGQNMVKDTADIARHRYYDVWRVHAHV